MQVAETLTPVPTCKLATTICAQGACRCKYQAGRSRPARPADKSSARRVAATMVARPVQDKRALSICRGLAMSGRTISMCAARTATHPACGSMSAENQPADGPVTIGFAFCSRRRLVFFGPGGQK